MKIMEWKKIDCRETSKLKGIMVLIGWFALMYAANALMPLYRDDYWAGLIWKTGNHLESMGDVVLSLERYYLLHGGRLVSFFIQFVFMLVGKNWFNMANALVFAVMCAVMVMHVRRRIDCLDKPGLLFLAGLFMWLGLSHFGEVAIWLCGSTVYLWTGLFTAIFLIPYNFSLAGTMQLPDGWLTITMLLLGVIAACSVENLTVTTTLLVFWCCWHAHRQGCFKYWMGTGAVGSLIGSVICLIAPGNFVRIEEDQDRSWLFHFLNQIVGNLEMILYMMPIIMTLVLAVRLLYLETAKRRGIEAVPVSKGQHPYLLLTILLVTIVSFSTTGFVGQTIEDAIVYGFFLPLGINDLVLFDHFHNTMQGFEEAFIYLAGIAYVYLISVRSLGVFKERIRCVKEKIPCRLLVEDFPELRYGAFLIGLCFFNNVMMIGAPSFPGRALFSSTIMFIIGVMVILDIDEVKERLFIRPEGRNWRVGGSCLLTFIVLATMLVLYSIWREDTTRMAYIAQEAAAGKKVVHIAPSDIPEQRRVLRHIAYDDFDTGLTHDPVCDYYGLDKIIIDGNMTIEDVKSQISKK